MFRIKKSSGGEGEPVAEPERAEADELPVAKAQPRRPAAAPSRPLGSANFPVELARRASDVASAAQPSSAGRERTLIAGKEVRMKGEVLACDKLVIEGDAEVNVSGCKHLHVGHSGNFRGSADVADAEIGGQFEGNLTVRGRLAVRPTGRIRGVIRYGQLVIEVGGQVVGDIGTLDGTAAATATGTAAATATGSGLAAVAGGPAAAGAGVAGDRSQPANLVAENAYVAPSSRL